MDTNPNRNEAQPVRERLLRLPAVEADTGLKKSAIYAGVRAGTFPVPVRLSGRFVAWRESEIQAWIASRCTELAR